MISSEDSLNNNNDKMVSGFDESTCSGDSDCDIFDNADDIITENSTVWVNTNGVISQGKTIKISFRKLPQDFNNLKLIQIDTKKEDRVLIQNCSRECRNKIIPISTQKYKKGADMDESVFYITLKMQINKKGMTTTHVDDFVGTYVVKLCGVKTDNYF